MMAYRYLKSSRVNYAQTLVTKLLKKKMFTDREERVKYGIDCEQLTQRDNAILPVHMIFPLR